VTPYADTLHHLPLVDLETDEAASAYLWIRAEMTTQGVEELPNVEPVSSSLLHNP
jgi:hypothetical protein